MRETGREREEMGGRAGKGGERERERERGRRGRKIDRFLIALFIAFISDNNIIREVIKFYTK